MNAGKLAVLIGLGLCVTTSSMADVTPDQSGYGKLFDPEDQRSISSQLEGSVAKLVGSPNNFKVNLIDARGAQRTVVLPSLIAQVNNIVWPSARRIAVIGMVNGSGYMVAVIDVPQARVLDTFLGYEVTLSPNKAFVVFVKYFQPYGVSGQEDRVRMYDFSRPAIQNRPVKSSFPPLFEDGIPVYPVLTVDQEAARPNIERPDSDAYNMASAFKWSDDSSHVLFVSLHGEHELALVSAIPSGQVAVADLSPTCGTHCLWVRAANVSILDHGVALDLEGTGKFLGKNEHVTVREEEFSSLDRRDKH
jgi:hypothetical protein